MKTLLKFLFLLTFSPAWNTSSQTRPEQDSLLNLMGGKWVLNGTIAGKETTHAIFADWVLGQQYIRIREISRERDSNGNPASFLRTANRIEQNNVNYSTITNLVPVSFIKIKKNHI